ncbi:MAG: PTS sugar transporter subunit IIA [Myxococcota bacterium]|jgi:PTS system mannose-specific IIA component
MVGLVIASHGRLAEELLSTATQIVGSLPKVTTCSVAPGASADDVKQQLRDAVKAVDDGDGVIVFADLIGGSPCTQSLSLCQQANLEVITGVNLPMLLKANTLRGAEPKLSLAELAHQLASYGQRNITCATDVLRAKAPAA